MSLTVTKILANDVVLLAKEEAAVQGMIKKN
jgi:hypothetical protein